MKFLLDMLSFQTGHRLWNFNKIFGFQELENCTKTDLINCFLLNARFLIYRCKVEKKKQTNYHVICKHH